MHSTDNIDLVKNALYDKSHVCPLCNHKFTSKAIRIGKNRLLSLDEDLHAHYSIVNPLVYDVIVCPECKYSAPSRNFTTLMTRHKTLLKSTFIKSAINITFNEYLTIDEAIAKHKLALLASMTKNSKVGEQAYIALHIAWLYRDKGDTENELVFIERAYTGFHEAFSTQDFPIEGYDEGTLLYVLAAMAHQLGKINESRKLLSSLIALTGLSPKLKEHMSDLKEKLALLD